MMTPRTQVIAGNWAGAVAACSLLIALIGSATGAGVLQALYAVFVAAVVARMFLESREDRIRINADGEIHINGRPTSVDYLLNDLRVGDPHLATQPTGRGSAAFRPQLRWMVWVERQYDEDHVPDEALKVVALLRDHDVPFGCTWAPPRLAESPVEAKMVKSPGRRF